MERTKVNGAVKSGAPISFKKRSVSHGRVFQILPRGLNIMALLLVWLLYILSQFHF